jgi:hypothetical protein
MTHSILVATSKPDLGSCFGTGELDSVYRTADAASPGIFTMLEFRT